MIDLSRVRVFREVATRRSFSRAAEALSFTQPSVSHHVSTLEAELGQTLVNRGARPITLTQAGQILFAAAEVALAEFERAEKELRLLAEGSSGRVSLGSVVTGLRSVVPAAIAEFRKRFPKVELALAELQPPEVFARLRSGELDVGIVVVAHDRAPPPATTFESHLLTEQPLMVALPPSHRLAGRRHVGLSALAEETWLLPARERFPEFRAEVDRLLGESGVLPRRALDSSDDLAGAGLVAAGVGVALVPGPAKPPVAGVALLPIRPAVGRQLFAVRIAGRDDTTTGALLDALKRAGSA